MKITIEFYKFELVYRFQISASKYKFDYLKEICHKKDTSGQKRKEWLSPLNSLYLSQTKYQISVETDNFHFLD